MSPSAKTARNVVPHAHRWLVDKLAGFDRELTVLDYGCGPYETGAEFLGEGLHLPEVLPYDPENRTERENEASLSRVYHLRGADVVIMSNVLNVISSKTARAKAVKHAFRNVGPGGALVVTCWPGDGSGIGAPTRDGYQTNGPLMVHATEIDEALKAAGYQFTWGRSGRVLVFERHRFNLLQK